LLLLKLALRLPIGRALSGARGDMLADRHGQDHDEDEEVPLPALFMPPAPKERPFKCPHGCGSKYTSQRALTNHCRKFHSVTSSCCREDNVGERNPEREEKRRARRAQYVREKRHMRPTLKRETLHGLTLSSPLLECATLCVTSFVVAEHVSSYEERVKAGEWVALFFDGSIHRESSLFETHDSALRHVTHRPTWTVTGVARIGKVLTWGADSSEAPILCTSKVSFDRSFVFGQPQQMPRDPNIARFAPAHPLQDRAIAWTFTSLPRDAFMCVKRQAQEVG